MTEQIRMLISGLAFAAAFAFALARFVLPRLIAQFAPDVPFAWVWNKREQNLFLLAFAALLVCLTLPGVSQYRFPLPALLLVAPLAALSYFDGRSQYLPDMLQLMCLAMSVLALHLAPAFMATSQDAVVSLVCLAVLRRLMALYERLRGIEGMGLGDIKLLAWMGLWLPPAELLACLMLGSAFALVFHLTRRLKGVNLTRHDPFAFGPWIIFAFCILVAKLQA